MRQPFLLIKRDVRGNKIWYAKIWNEEKRRYNWKSVASIKQDLGAAGKSYPHTSKAGSATLVKLWLSENALNDESLLIDYLQEFWTEESDYIKSKKLRGQNHSAEYLKINKSAIDNRFKTFLENTKMLDTLLEETKPELLESFINYLSDLESKLSNRRINQIMQSV
ncbi:MAG: hypothetical protein PQJ59_12795 [Spirochaetales bacterium]|nr:hypothetical protein [Spirochaetales bacterium]